MATTINASNGATSGLIQTGDASGILQLQVNNGTAAVTLNTSGAVGVGSTPAYGSSGEVLISGGSGAAPSWGAVTVPAGATITNPTITGALISTSTLTGPTITGYTETVYALGTSGSLALNPANGTVQTCDASGTVTFTDSLSSGQSIVLMLTNGSTYTINYPTITWVGPNGNTAPTLAGGNTLVFWKVGSTLYGAMVGKYA